MKFTLTPISAAIAALAGMAAELHAAGAIRPEHAEKFNLMRTGIDQAVTLVNEASEAAEGAATPSPDAATPSPDAAAFAELKTTQETLALTVDHLADKVQELIALATPKAEG